MPFSCSICGEESTRICVRCTKDACENHLCEKCRRCSDCCECEVALAPHAAESVRDALHGAVAAQAEAPLAEASPATPEAVAEQAPAPAEAMPVGAQAPVVEAPSATPEAVAEQEPTAAETLPVPTTPAEAPAKDPESPEPPQV